MASVNTITAKEYRNGVKVITAHMKCGAGDPAFTDVNLEERGKRLQKIFTIPGTPGPTADSDISLTDQTTTLDLIATNGTDAVDTSTVNEINPDSATNVVVGRLVSAIANNAVNAAELTVVYVFSNEVH